MGSEQSREKEIETKTVQVLPGPIAISIPSPEFKKFKSTLPELPVQRFKIEFKILPDKIQESKRELEMVNLFAFFQPYFEYIKHFQQTGPYTSSFLVNIKIDKFTIGDDDVTIFISNYGVFKVTPEEILRGIANSGNVFISYIPNRIDGEVIYDEKFYRPIITNTFDIDEYNSVMDYKQSLQLVIIILIKIDIVLKVVVIVKN